MTCPTCSAHNQSAAHYCAICGSSLSESEADPTPRRPLAPWALLAASLALVMLSIIALRSDTLQPALSEVGLNTQPCAEGPFGQELCGSALAAFCAHNYVGAPQQQACIAALRDVGKDPEAIARAVVKRDRPSMGPDVYAQREADDLARLRAANRIDAELGRYASDDTIALRLDDWRRASSVGSDLGRSRPSADSYYAVFDFRVRNESAYPVQAICLWVAGGAGLLVDARSRQYSLDADATTNAPSNRRACGDDLQPGQTRKLTLVFELSADAVPREVLVWDPTGASYDDGGTHLAWLLQGHEKAA